MIGFTREKVISVPVLTELILLDRQASHSAATANRAYAITPTTTTSAVLEQHFFLLCAVWQQMLGTSLHIETPLPRSSSTAAVVTSIAPAPTPAKRVKAPSPKATLQPTSKEFVVLREKLRQAFDDDQAEFLSEGQLAAVHQINGGPDLLWIEGPKVRYVAPLTDLTV